MRVTVELEDKRLVAEVPDVEELSVNGSALPGTGGSLSYTVTAKNSHGGEVLALAGISSLEIHEVGAEPPPATPDIVDLG